MQLNNKRQPFRIAKLKILAYIMIFELWPFQCSAQLVFKLFQWIFIYAIRQLTLRWKDTFVFRNLKEIKLHVRLFFPISIFFYSLHVNLYWIKRNVTLGVKSIKFTYFFYVNYALFPSNSFKNVKENRNEINDKHKKVTPNR